MKRIGINQRAVYKYIKGDARRFLYNKKESNTVYIASDSCKQNKK